MPKRFAWLAIGALMPLAAYAQSSTRDEQAEAARRAQIEAARRAEAEEAKAASRDDDSDRRRAYECAYAQARQRAALKASSIAPKAGTQKQEDTPCATCKPPECE
jgi:hypothetical protein